MPRSKYNITIQIIYKTIINLMISFFKKEIQLYHKLFLEYYEVYYLVFCKRGPFLFGLLWRHSFKVNSRLSIVVGFRFVRGAGELIFKIFERMRQKKDEWGPWNKKVMSKKWNGKIMYQPTYAFFAVIDAFLYYLSRK